MQPAEIRGGATEFEAAVVAALLDHMAQTEKTASKARSTPDTSLPAWVHALHPTRACAAGWNCPHPLHTLIPGG